MMLIFCRMHANQYTPLVVISQKQKPGEKKDTTTNSTTQKDKDAKTVVLDAESKAKVVTSTIQIQTLSQNGTPKSSILSAGKSNYMLKQIDPESYSPIVVISKTINRSVKKATSERTTQQNSDTPRADAKKTLNFHDTPITDTAANQNPSVAQRVSTRRRSMKPTQDVNITPNSVATFQIVPVDDDEETVPAKTTRRRSSIHVTTSIETTTTDDGPPTKRTTQKKTIRKEITAIAEEVIAKDANKIVSTDQQRSNRVSKRRTTFTNKTLEISNIDGSGGGADDDKIKKSSVPTSSRNRRKTTYTPAKMDEEQGDGISAEKQLQRQTRSSAFVETPTLIEALQRMARHRNRQSVRECSSSSSLTTIQPSPEEIICCEEIRNLLGKGRKSKTDIVVQPSTDQKKLIPYKSASDSSVTDTITSNNDLRNRQTLRDMDVQTSKVDIMPQSTILGDSVATDTNDLDNYIMLNTEADSRDDSDKTDSSTLKQTEREDTLVDESAPVNIFSSTLLPGKRRTLHDVSLHVLSQRAQSINRTTARRSIAPIYNSPLVPPNPDFNMDGENYRLNKSVTTPNLPSELARQLTSCKAIHHADIKPAISYVIKERDTKDDEDVAAKISTPQIAETVASTPTTTATKKRKLFAPVSHDLTPIAKVANIGGTNMSNNKKRRTLNGRAAGGALATSSSVKTTSTVSSTSPANTSINDIHSTSNTNRRRTMAHPPKHASNGGLGAGSANTIKTTLQQNPKQKILTKNMSAATVGSASRNHFRNTSATRTPIEIRTNNVYKNSGSNEHPIVHSLIPRMTKRPTKVDKVSSNATTQHINATINCPNTTDNNANINGNTNDSSKTVDAVSNSPFNDVEIAAKTPEGANRGLGPTSEEIGAARRKLPFMVYTNMHKDQIKVIHEAVRNLGGFLLENSVSDSTTHVISLEPRRTLNLLRALARGLWILEYSWVLESIRLGHWAREESYEIKDFSRAVEICRAERQAFGITYRCELFTHLGPFFISSRCGPISRENLRELINLCGGKVTDQRKRAKYVLGDSNKIMDDKVYITPYWILDSITQMQLLKFTKYSLPPEGKRLPNPPPLMHPYTAHLKLEKALMNLQDTLQQTSYQITRAQSEM